MIEFKFQNLSRAMWQELIELSTKFNSQGYVENDLSEEEIDIIFGEKAITSAFESVDLFELLEQRDTIFNGKIYFNSDEEGTVSFIASIDKLKIEYRSCQSEDVDWNHEWKKNYKRIDLTERISIVPSWEKIRNIQSEVYIYPGQGFGTGTHETTQMCLKILDIHIKKMNENINALDFGCGSGILGIALQKLFNKDKMVSCHYMDIDESALENCRQNYSLNFDSELNSINVSTRKAFKQDMKYNLIFANILLEILLQEHSVIAGSLVPGGYLIASGLLREQEEKFLEKYLDTEMELVNKQVLNDWIAILLRKK